MRDLYAPLKCKKILVTDLKSAELIKHASNSFLATKVSFINSVSRICELVGADAIQVAEGMGLDPRIGGRVDRESLGRILRYNCDAMECTMSRNLAETPSHRSSSSPKILQPIANRNTTRLTRW